ncbi:MAG: DMT family transporter [Staphylothermus sp.]|nr:DMT family transporter [Staphylothermus sp.]
MVREYKYLLALLGTVVFWGSSFPIIKYLMNIISEYSYTWVRGFFSIVFLTPYLLWFIARRAFTLRCLKGGLLAGVFYSLGLWLQAWGTRYTTASNSAFITGLNVLFVHVFTAVFYKRYSKELLLSLLTSVTGLYLLTMPTDAITSIQSRIGDFLVLLGAVMWALQILAVDKYSECDPFIFIYFMFLPTLFFAIPDMINNSFQNVFMRIDAILLLIYLALICNIGAFSLQVYGQKRIRPEVTAIVFLLEPVFASIFSYFILAETMSFNQIIGATLIILSMYLASKHMYK